jgi:hypothetical protein
MQILFEGRAGLHQRTLQQRSACTVAMTIDVRRMVAT